ncbi:MAG: hypothetical protein ACYSUT_10215 [Planctomycetota bacterium]
MRYLLLSVLAAAMAVMLCGCQESSSSGSSADIQRARLVGNENIQLKKQLAAKDAEIEQLKKDIEQIKAEKADAIQQSGETNIKVMKIVLESETRNTALKAENAKLKAELEKLKNQ